MRFNNGGDDNTITYHQPDLYLNPKKLGTLIQRAILRFVGGAKEATEGCRTLLTVRRLNPVQISIRLSGKVCEKHQARLLEKIISFIEECEALYGIKVVYNSKATLHTMKRLRKKLYQIREEEQITFSHGIDHRKTSCREPLKH